MEEVPAINKCYIFMIPISICLASFVMGYLLVYFTMMEPFIKDYHKYTDLETEVYFSLTTTLLPLGAFLSSLFYALIIRRLGENLTLKIMDGIVLLAVLLQAITIYTPVLCLARLLMGVYCGIILGLVPTFVVSLTPSEFRGYTGTFSQIAITMGILAAYLMGQTLDR